MFSRTTEAVTATKDKKTPLWCLSISDKAKQRQKNTHSLTEGWLNISYVVKWKKWKWGLWKSGLQ